VGGGDAVPPSSEITMKMAALHSSETLVCTYCIVLYCIVFLFSPNIIYMIIDSSVCNIF
jgi:hypothetical protein